MAEERDSLLTEPEDDPEGKGLKAHLDERAQLIDAGREAARTFDKAVLTFGAAVFGFSIAFLKDVAPHPTSDTLKWLGGAWLLFSLGLLTILVAFLLSQEACEWEITQSANEARAAINVRSQKNPWTTATKWGNVGCIVFLFLGLVSWSIFALENLGVQTTTSTSAPQAKP